MSQTFFLILKKKNTNKKREKKNWKRKKHTQKVRVSLISQGCYYSRYALPPKVVVSSNLQRTKAPLNWYSLSLSLSLLFSSTIFNLKVQTPTRLLLLPQHYSFLSLHGYGHGRKKLRKKERKVPPLLYILLFTFISYPSKTPIIIIQK